MVIVLLDNYMVGFEPIARSMYYETVIYYVYSMYIYILIYLCMYIIYIYIIIYIHTVYIYIYIYTHTGDLDYVNI